MYPRFVGKYLNYHKHLGAYSLDPRFPEVREFLIETYLRALRDFDLDGFKLDFVDAMGLNETSPTNYDEMDCRSLEEGVRRLLQETHQRLSAEKPDILIEFRQSYVGPIVSTAGNMFRVGDCPMDLIHHRSRVLDLRWTSGSTAVHSDMIIWHEEDTVEAAAHQLWGTLFGVPQISVRLGEMREEHKALIHHYLAFWRAHRATILDGSLDVSAPEAWYAMATAKGKDERITVLYQAVPVEHHEPIAHYVVNVTGKDGVYADLAHDVSYEILSSVGTPLAQGSLKAGIHKLPVPDAGLVVFH
jgi:alpha-galactosidase